MLVMGTPLTGLMSRSAGEIPLDMRVAAAAMVVAAFLPRVPRVAGFAAGICTMVALHHNVLLNWNLGTQLACTAPAQYSS